MKGKGHLLFSLGLLYLMQAGGICWSQTTERVSVNTAGGNADGGSNASAISSDGRYVAFQSAATDLVPAGSNGLIQIFVRDRQTGTTTQASMNSGGQEGDFPSSAPSISGDGWHVAFESWATNLAAIGDGIFPDIFVHNRQTGETIRVSVDSAGAEGGGPSFHPSISADGRYVAFDSDADLVATDSGDYYDIFVHDRQTGETIRASVDAGGNESNGHSTFPSISADGRYVAFESFATDLVPGGTNGNGHIFVHDLQTGITTLVSVDSNGIQGNGDCSAPSISSDGKFVAFESEAELVADDNGIFSDIFVHEGDPLPPSTTQSKENNSSGSGGCFITAAAGGWVGF
jgi:Tol biopolymer transport system component